MRLFLKSWSNSTFSRMAARFHHIPPVLHSTVEISCQRQPVKRRRASISLQIWNPLDRLRLQQRASPSPFQALPLMTEMRSVGPIFPPFPGRIIISIMGFLTQPLPATRPPEAACPEPLVAAWLPASEGEALHRGEHQCFMHWVSLSFEGGKKERQQDNERNGAAQLKPWTLHTSIIHQPVGVRLLESVFLLF